MIALIVIFALIMSVAAGYIKVLGSDQPTKLELLKAEILSE